MEHSLISEELDTTIHDEENANILLKERYELLQWKNSVEMRTPNLLIPVQIANYVESLPFCKLSVSPKCDRIALMSYARLLDIYTLTGEILEHESSVQVLEESQPEYCLLQFSSSGSLILSSRSTPHIDVFDNMGAYCYDIPLQPHEGIFDMNSAVCAMQTVPNNSISANDKYLEILYVLQYSGIFSAFKIGRLSKYTKMWSVQLDIGLTGAFVVLPQYNLLLVASHYKNSAVVNPPAGLCSFRMMDSDPYVEPIRISTPDDGWFSRLPFSTSFMSYLPKMSLSNDQQLLVSVSTSGSLYIFQIPSTHVRYSFVYLNGPRPVEACFVADQEIAIIYDNGYLLRCSLDNIEEKMNSMKSINRKQVNEYEQKDLYGEHTIMVSPAEREIFLLSAEGDNSVLREAAHKRVQLAGQLWLFTVWNSFKKLVGMAMGDSAEPLQMATHVARFEFSLSHSPTRTLQELFDRTLIEHDYARARELANSYKSIDYNIVLKSEWYDKCRKEAISVDDVESILGEVSDDEWVAEQCANVLVEDLDVQFALVRLGLSLKNISIIWKIRLIHHRRLLNVCRINDNVDMFLKIRNRSLLEAAIMFANNGDIESLYHLIEGNLQVLRHHQNRILSSIPCCLHPNKFEQFMPKMDESGRISYWNLTEKEESNEMVPIVNENPDAVDLVKSVNSGDIKDEEEFDFVDWIRKTALRMDVECGIPTNCIELIRVAIDRGFEVLKQDIPKWKLYSNYVTICSSINESMKIFEQCDASQFVEKFAKLLESQLIANANDIISLIEWKLKDSEQEAIGNHLCELMKLTNERSSNVLVAYHRCRPDLINDDVILETLLNMTCTGSELLQSMRSLPIEKYSNVSSALGSLMSRGVKITFKSIFESMKEPDGAKRVLIKLSRSGNCETMDDWESLRDDVVDMAQGIYGNMINQDEALQLVAQEILEDERIGQNLELMSLVLTMNPKQQVGEERRLSAQKSAEVLLAKSDDLMSEATHKDDPLLGRARFYAISARHISPEGAKEKLKWLDAIELAQELGCNMMPIAIKLSDHDRLLDDIVHIGANYKQGKKIAKLAMLLNIETPVATALSYCALAALNVNDATYLSRYIGEVISKARGIPVVHQLCMRILQSPHVPTDMEDIYACAMMNCSEENLLATVDAIAESEEKLKKAKKVQKCDVKGLKPCDQMVLDPMYTPIDSYNGYPIMGDVEATLKNVKKNSSEYSIEEMRKVMAYESSSMSMIYSLNCDSNMEDDEWISHEKLNRYERALKEMSERIPLSILVRLSPTNVIRVGNQGDEAMTAIDRIEDYGCDKTRFMDDEVYREDAVIGLAMTESEQQFSDALELASKYGFDEWDIHMTSLENAIVSLPITDAKSIIKTRGHLAKLRSRIDDFHETLRSSVLPLLGSNEKFIAYLTLFADSEPEKKSMPIIKKILEKKRDVKAFKMWTDGKYLTDLLVTIPDKILCSIAGVLRQFPHGRDACEATARILLNGTETRPPANPYALYLLLRKDLDELFELIAVKPRDEEVEYLENAKVLLEATPSVPRGLIDAVVMRAEKMRRSTISPELSGNSSNSWNAFGFGSFDDSGSNGGMMMRRKKT